MCIRDRVCVGGIDKRQINLDQVENFPIILPPKEKQKQFAIFATQILSLIHIYKNAVIKRQVKADKLHTPKNRCCRGYELFGCCFIGIQLKVVNV